MHKSMANDANGNELSAQELSAIYDAYVDKQIRLGMITPLATKEEDAAWKNAAERSSMNPTISGDILNFHKELPSEKRPPKFIRSETDRDKNLTTWRCNCWLPGENWCDHLNAYWKSRADRETILNGWRLPSRSMTYRYTMARGLADVDIKSTSYNMLELTGEDINSIRLEFGELQMWMEDDLSSVDLLDQIESVVRQSHNYEECSKFFYGVRAIFCLSKYHNSKVRNTLMRTFDGLDTEMQKEYVFANAFYSVTRQKCIVCVKEDPWDSPESRKERMAKDLDFGGV